MAWPESLTLSRRRAEPPLPIHWRAEADSDGVCIMRHCGGPLRYQQVAELVAWLRSAARRFSPRELILDLGAVERIEPPWTPVIAQLLAFARSSATHFRLRRLRAKPAAIAQHLLKGTVCRSFVEVESPSPA